MRERRPAGPFGAGALHGASIDLPRFGVTLETRADLAGLQALRGADAASHAFDPARGVFDDAFWIRGTRADGRVVHVQAMGLIGAPGPIGGWLRRRLADFAPPGTAWDAADANPALMAGPAGPSVHHGGLWIAPDWRDRQGFAFLTAASNLAIALALRVFAGAPVWALTADRPACARLARRGGYARHVPAALTWRARGRPVLAESLWWVDQEAFAASSRFEAALDALFSTHRMLSVSGAPARPATGTTRR